MKSAQKHTYWIRNTFVVVSGLIGILVGVALIRGITTFKSQAANAASVYFSPDEVNIPPESAINIMVNPGGQSLSFVRVRINYDPSVLSLAANVNTSTSPLQQIVSVTPSSEANQNGALEIVLAQKPGTTVPTTTFQLAGMTFTLAPGATNSQSTEITVVDEDTQLVNSARVAVLFDTPNFVAVNSAAEAIGGGAAAPRDNVRQEGVEGDCPSELYIDTAIGCIPYSDSQAIAGFFLRWGLGIAGGIAFILIVIASYKIITSQGDPKRLQSGKELLVGAITGLLMLIFSAFILRFIGVDLLGVF